MISAAACPTGLAHVAIAVTDAESTAAEYARLFGARIEHREFLSDRGLSVIFLDIAGVHVELVEPFDPSDETNTVARFLQKRGQGLHHVAFGVPSADAALAHAIAEGAEPIDRAPRPGARGTRVAFLHPRSTSGALIEFAEPAPAVVGTPAGDER
jgi:methylmalonyl-CoA epimerase